MSQKFIIPINQELTFEKELTNFLKRHGWEDEILLNPSEEQLLENWAHIIYNNNRDQDRLGNFPLTKSEMAQIVRRFEYAGNPYERNKLLTGGVIDIIRDNPDDIANKGKTIYLKLFDTEEINTGQSRYQIVRQPKLHTRHPLAGDRRGDMMLLINGIPLIHIELKRSGVDVSQAANQIKKYTHEGVFSQGIFSLVQVFVAMTPEKTIYFANPGEAKKFNKAFYFHWADFNNEEMHDWKEVAANLLSIPMAHRMIGKYTIADDKDHQLKVLRSYQYYAINAICDKVHNNPWDSHSRRGGFIWHTTGSGKTLTSFKAAQLIAKAHDADKVVFLLDRIELSTQSVDEYRGFANADDNVLDTENTARLVSHLESDDINDNLIVTSLQKMARVTPDYGISQTTIDHINGKRVVFIVDECHRGVFGEMLTNIKNTFPRALLFGFTGTPIFEDNARGEVTTETIFGPRLHNYTIAHAIPDGNVLGFDIYRENTFQEEDIRLSVALRQCGVDSEEEIGDDKEKRKIFDFYTKEADILKVEEKAKSIYYGDNHHLTVMLKIMEDFPTISRNGLFHSILATKSIPEAIAYYKLFRKHYPDYNVVAVFDDKIDNEGGAEYKEDAILEMLEDYNRKFKTNFDQASYAKYKKDVAKRLAHKPPYKNLHKSEQINLLIVVTQMLTGYDSKFINALYVDKLMSYVDIIQSFSRTNRIFGPEKPFGIIKYFTRPNQMKKDIDSALELYVDQPMSIYIDKLEANLEKINKAFKTIEALFQAESISNFECLPKNHASRNKFAKEFCAMNRFLEAAKMQGFRWDKTDYEFQHSYGWVTLKMEIDEETYMILRQRYKELFERTGPGEGGDDDVYEIDPYLTEQGEGTIDAEYINSNFIKFVKYLYTEGEDSERVKKLQQELHKTFSQLSQRDQKTALIIINDIQRGDLRLKPGKTIYDYIKDYQKKEVDEYLYALCELTGLNSVMLKEIASSEPNDQNINDHGRFDNLMKTLDKERSKVFLSRVTGEKVRPLSFLANMRKLVKTFLIDPVAAKKILYAFSNETAVFNLNADTESQIQEAEELDKPKDQDGSRGDSTHIKILSEKEMQSNISTLVMRNLRSVKDWCGTAKAVSTFFKILELKSLNSLDGISLDFEKVFDELFARNPVKFIDKHTGLSLLLIRFEVFLKKLYYLIHDREIVAPTGENVSLKHVLPEFDCLWQLKSDPSRAARKLSEFLKNLKEWRNTDTGNGAHAAIYLSEEELDRRIEIVVSLYVYVTGSLFKELVKKFPQLENPPV